MFSDNGVHLFLRRRNDIMIHILLLYHVHPHSMVIVHEDRATWIGRRESCNTRYKYNTMVSSSCLYVCTLGSKVGTKTTFNGIQRTFTARFVPFRGAFLNHLPLLSVIQIVSLVTNTWNPSSRASSRTTSHTLCCVYIPRQFPTRCCAGVVDDLQLTTYYNLQLTPLAPG